MSLNTTNRLELMKLTTQIVASAAGNEHLNWNANSLEVLTEAIYKKMAELVDSSSDAVE